MLVDYFTNPLMGERFREFRNVIMGYKLILYLHPNSLHSIKEHVGKPPKSEKEKSQKCVIEFL